MKKYLVMIMVVLVMVFFLIVFLIGCAGVQTTTSQVAQDVGIIAQKACNFDVNMSNEAQMAINFMAFAAPKVGPLVGIPITEAQAEAVLNVIANAAGPTTCVLLTDFQNALTYFNALSAKYKSVQKAQGLKAPVPVLLNLNAKLTAEKSLKNK